MSQRIPLFYLGLILIVIAPLAISPTACGHTFCHIVKIRYH